MDKEETEELDYKAEYERLKQNMQGNAGFYSQVIQERDNEIEWLKKLISKILQF